MRIKLKLHDKPFVLFAAITLVAMVLGLVLVPLQLEAGHLLKPEDTVVVAQGKKVYDQHCASCHGVNLEGQPNWRQRDENGLLPAPPHDASGHTWHHHDELLFRLTKFGPSKLMGGEYKSAMPGFEKVISDADILSVLSYIKSTWPSEVKRIHDDINKQSGH